MPLQNSQCDSLKESFVDCFFFSLSLLRLKHIFLPVYLISIVLRLLLEKVKQEQKSNIFSIWSLISIL
jgi:hypothetical protein